MSNTRKLHSEMTKLELIDNRLGGDNPVAWVKVTPDMWKEIRAQLEDEFFLRFGP